MQSKPSIELLLWCSAAEPEAIVSWNRCFGCSYMIPRVSRSEGRLVGVFLSLP